MNRRAVLIESSRISGQPDLPGARVDVLGWKRFLLSGPGGAWDANEITLLSKPSEKDLLAFLKSEAGTDYVFIAFSGHGEHVKGNGLDETRLCLTEHDDVPIHALNPGNPRCTIIVDACRQVVLLKALLEAVETRDMGAVAERIDRVAYRRIFDLAVSQAERGVIRLYSCSIDEAANEIGETGGVYTSALVRSCEDWHKNAPSGKPVYFSLWGAHEEAAKRMMARYPQQHPKYDGGRRNLQFPLAVKA